MYSKECTSTVTVEMSAMVIILPSQMEEEVEVEYCIQMSVLSLQKGANFIIIVLLQENMEAEVE